ncbi:hypothetical protein Syun_007023 [Stephania yunnanensis]|uniref:Uncharacterized protein n=1 Tax=Stephania yunnanensis TaxID=152371 RepID=A0AAP0KZF8_9MAGN
MLMKLGWQLLSDPNAPWVDFLKATNARFWKDNWIERVGRLWFHATQPLSDVVLGKTMLFLLRKERRERITKSRTSTNRADSPLNLHLSFSFLRNPLKGSQHVRDLEVNSTPESPEYDLVGNAWKAPNDISMVPQIHSYSSNLSTMRTGAGECVSCLEGLQSVEEDLDGNSGPQEANPQPIDPVTVIRQMAEAFLASKARDREFWLRRSGLEAHRIGRVGVDSSRPKSSSFPGSRRGVERLEVR